MERGKKPGFPNGPLRRSKSGAGEWRGSMLSGQAESLRDESRSKSGRQTYAQSLAAIKTRHYAMPLVVDGSVNAPTPASASGSARPNEPQRPSDPFADGARIQISRHGSAPRNLRLCIDFGTSTSKVILIDDSEPGQERIEVLDLDFDARHGDGKPFLLTAAVYIDNAGKLWFGRAAERLAREEGVNSSRKRVDNIKWRLCRREWNEEIHRDYNPTSLSITYGDMVLAYLMFLTWSINACLLRRSFPLNILRRFTTPCLPRKTSKGIIQRLRASLAESQILADSFGERITQGLPVQDFLSISRRLTDRPIPHPYVIEHTSEPLAVIGSRLEWNQVTENLTMVLDIGASSVDFALYRIHVGENSSEDLAIEIPGGSYTLRLGGNNLDWILFDHIISKAGKQADDALEAGLRAGLNTQIRGLKESLFTQGHIECLLADGTAIEVTLPEFLALERVEEFGRTIRDTFHKILNSINSSWIRWVLHRADRHLVLVLTGGGASMPMITAMGENLMEVRGKAVPVEPAHGCPAWLKSAHGELEADYPRLAVSLGGARRRRFREGRLGLDRQLQNPT